MNRSIGTFFVALSTAAMFAGCVDDPGAASPAATPDGTGAAPAAGRASAAWAQTVGAPTTSGLAPAYALASRNADVLVASRPPFLFASPHDAFAQGRVVSSSGLFYVPYERTYAGLPVVGGDFVTVVDGAGRILYNSSALERQIDLASIAPSLSQVAAEAIASRQLRSVTRVELSLIHISEP